MPFSDLYRRQVEVVLEKWTTAGLAVADISTPIGAAAG